MTDYTVSRDRWGRPYISNDGGPLKFKKGRVSPINAEAYTRVSTLADALGDKGNLIPWNCANAMVGMVKDPSIAAQVRSLASKYDNPWYVPEGKKAIQPLVERAQAAGGGDRASSFGTSYHEFTEVIDEGRWPEYAPAELIPWLHAYREAMEGFECLGMELFVVNDELKTAGSFDRVLRTPGGRVVVSDTKSGRSDPDYPLKVTLQVATYANSVRYDQATGERSPIHPDLDLTTGLLVHAPILGGGKPEVKVYPLDLVRGMELARLAVQVREARSWERSKDARLVAL